MFEFRTANSEQIGQELGRRIAAHRLSQNMTQSHLAEVAGVGVSTVKRLENGKNPQLDSVIRIVKALGLSGNLDAAFPEYDVRPVERVKLKGHERQRARPSKQQKSQGPFVWGEDKPKK